MRVTTLEVLAASEQRRSAWAGNLLLEAELRILAHQAGVASIHVEDRRLHFGVRDARALDRHFQGAPHRPRLITAELAVVDSGFPRNHPEGLALFLKRLFEKR